MKYGFSMLNFFLAQTLYLSENENHQNLKAIHILN
jgi:hypothetical protein